MVEWRLALRGRLRRQAAVRARTRRSGQRSNSLGGRCSLLRRWRLSCAAAIVDRPPQQIADVHPLIQARAWSSSLTWNALISAFVKNRAKCIDA